MTRVRIPSSGGKLALLIAIPLIAALAAVLVSLPEGAGEASSLVAGVEAIQPTSTLIETAAPTPIERARAADRREPQPPPEGLNTTPALPAAPATLDSSIAKIIGYLIDEATGDGLEDWVVEITGNPVWVGSSNLPAAQSLIRESLRSGPGGRFETRMRYAIGRYRIGARLDPCSSTGSPRRSGVALHSGSYRRPPSAVVHQYQHFVPPDPSRPLLVKVSTGPRYLLHAELPASLGPCDFQARLHDGTAAGATLGEPTRLGPGPPWRVRFSSAVHSTHKGPWTMTIRSERGEWYGSGQVDAIAGDCSQPVIISLRQRAKLVGRVIDSKSTGVAAARLRFLPGEAQTRTEVPVSDHTDSGGRFNFDFLPSGAGRLEVMSGNIAIHAERVVLPPGQTTQMTIRLAGVHSGELLGHLSAEAGGLDHPPRMRLTPLSPVPGELPRAIFGARQEGRMSFVFAPLPVGEYLLSVEAVDGFTWSPDRLRVRVPSAGIEIRRLDRENTMIVLDVLTAADDSPVPKAFGVLVGKQGIRRSSPGSGGPGTVILDGLDAHAIDSLLVGAHGYRIASISLAKLKRNGRFLTGTVRLTAGNERLVRVLDAANSRPLSGASLTIDGRVVASAASSGIAIVPSTGERVVIMASLDGWQSARIPAPPRDGGLLEVSLERDE